MSARANNRVSPALALACALFASCAARASEQVGLTADGTFIQPYFEETIALDIDRSRVAVRFEGPVDALERALMDAGLPSRIEAHALAGWWIATFEGAPARAGDVVDRLASLQETSVFPFVAPIFRDTNDLVQIPTPYVLVRFNDGLSRAEMRTTLTGAGATAEIELDFAGMPGLTRAGLTSTNGFDVLSSCLTLRARDDVLFAEPDWIFTARHAFAPNDPGFVNNLVWGIHNFGQSGGVDDMDMDGPEAWDLTTGDAGVLVVVIDTGIQMSHPDLNMGPGRDFTFDSTGGNPGNRCDNHGTAVAGCISAVIDNGLDTVGIAPGCRVASARVGAAVVTTPCGLSWSGLTSWTVSAIGWAEDIGARVTNNSNSMPITQSVAQAYLDTASNGIIHFASAGNDGDDDIHFPALVYSVNAVAALDRTGARWTGSNWGTGLEFSAPGAAIHTTDRTGTSGYLPSDTVILDGTSFAAPYAAGVAALAFAVDPALTGYTVGKLMEASSIDLGTGGYDTDFGYGFVNAHRAAHAANPTHTWVDFDYPYDGDGTFLSPYDTLAEGIALAPSGRAVIVRAGISRETLTVDRALRIEAFDGVVRIGSTSGARSHVGVGSNEPRR